MYLSLMDESRTAVLSSLLSQLAGSVYRPCRKTSPIFRCATLLCQPRSANQKESQNFPKKGSAQPSGSNSGGFFNQALNGFFCNFRVKFMCLTKQRSPASTRNSAALRLLKVESA